VGNAVRTSRPERTIALEVAAALRVDAVIVLRNVVQVGNCIRSRSLRYAILSTITAEVYTERILSQVYFTCVFRVRKSVKSGSKNTPRRCSMRNIKTGLSRRDGATVNY
jgi:hypothetical protein